MSDPPANELTPRWLVTVSLDPESGVPQATENMGLELDVALEALQRAGYILSYTIARVKP